MNWHEHQQFSHGSNVLSFGTTRTLSVARENRQNVGYFLMVVLLLYNVTEYSVGFVFGIRDQLAKAPSHFSVK